MNWSSKFVFHVKYLTFQNNHLGSDLNLSEKSLPVTNFEILERFILPIHRQHPPLPHRPLQSMSWIKLPFWKRATFCESWCERTIQKDRSHIEKQKTHKCGVWACVHTCGMVGGRGYSGAEWGHIHARGEKGLCCGVSRPVDFSEMLMPTATWAETPLPQCSSITPLFWAIPVSSCWLGIISFFHKKLCKSFHPLRWVLQAH